MWENNHLHNRKWEICPSIAIDTSYHAGNRMAYANHFHIKKPKLFTTQKSIDVPVYLGD